MKSIQARLILAISLTCVALFSVSGMLLYRSLHTTFTEQFDRSLLAQAQAITSLISVESDGTLEFEFSPGSMPAYHRGVHPKYFVVRFPDGRVMEQSRSLADASHLVLPAGTTVINLRLPSGDDGRALRMEFEPPLDDDAQAAAAAAHPPMPVKMNIIVARDRSSLTESLRHLLQAFIVAAGLLSLALVGTTALVVRHAMRPLRAVRNSAAQIKPSRLHLRLPEDGLPSELSPICRSMNELLARLDDAFARERRFTSDVAHELRTPITELKTTVDVALRWPDDVAGTRHALRESQQIARQMQTLVQTLLELVRVDSAPRASLESVALLEAVTRAARTVESIGVEKGVVVEIPPDATVLAEPTLLGSVLCNVLSNALEYSDGDAPIRCNAQSRDGQWLLSIENRAARFTEEDVRHMREPFWRKNAARSNPGEHAGLGLSLVDGFCKLMNVRLDAALRSPDIFCLTFTFAGGPSSPSHVSQV